MSDERPSLARRELLAALGAFSTSVMGGPAPNFLCPGRHGRGPSTVDVTIPFDKGPALAGFTEVNHGRHISLVSPCSVADGTILRVTIPEGDHFGTSLRFRFESIGVPEPLRLSARYLVYFPGDFVVRDPGGKLPGPAGTYGRGGWGGRPSNGRNGWSARGLFTRSGDPTRPVQLAYYAYHADMDGRFGDIFAWDRGSAGKLTLGSWHEIEQSIELNTPGENDGVLRGWVDGELAFERTDVRFRDIDDLRVQEFWFNVYYGGTAPSPVDNRIYFDELSLSWRGGGR